MSAEDRADHHGEGATRAGARPLRLHARGLYRLSPLARAVSYAGRRGDSDSVFFCAAETGSSAMKACAAPTCVRSEEHTSELQSLMRISYAVLCLKKKRETQ